MGYDEALSAIATGAAASGTGFLRANLCGKRGKVLSAQTGQEKQRLSLGPADRLLQGGLLLGELHEVAPAAPLYAGTAFGFALGLSVLTRDKGTIIFVQQDFAALENGVPYGRGCEFFGLCTSRLLLVRTATPRDTLWAMEEALKTRDITAVIGELAEDGKAADLTATRRLSLAVQKGTALCLLLRQRPSLQPSAAATRWEVAAAPGSNDRFGGLGTTAFRLTLTKNRRGACGNWVLQWDHHEQCFIPAISLAVAASAGDRPDGPAIARAG